MKVIYLKDVQNLRVCLAGCATCASMSRLMVSSVIQAGQYNVGFVCVARSFSTSYFADFCSKPLIPNFQPCSVQVSQLMCLLSTSLVPKGQWYYKTLQR